MRVVSDSSALIALERIGRLNILNLDKLIKEKFRISEQLYNLVLEMAGE